MIMENIESNNASMHVRTIAINMGNDTMNDNNHQIETFQLFCFVYLVSVCLLGVILNFKALSTLLSVILVRIFLYEYVYKYIPCITFLNILNGISSLFIPFFLF